ncbi:response regulator transcription factor [Nocardioides allogilvus]|uniref:response regulator transcription factor n=1 Tax=Nocardioides allogilvus TaxID=2072017 RepID=UPI001E3CB1EE|nr:LuxR C-terminal-related transcriptional regulator [Nocardioides allogilvus]
MPGSYAGRDVPLSRRGKHAGARLPRPAPAGGAGAEVGADSARDQVIKLIAEGRSSREIARDLHIALKTVEGHRANILGKLGMRDRVELTRYAMRAGLIEP